MICPECGKEFQKKPSDRIKIYCYDPECLRKRKNRQVTTMYYKRKASGICVTCGHSKTGTKTRCKKCAVEASKVNLQCYYNRKQKGGA